MVSKVAQRSQFQRHMPVVGGPCAFECETVLAVAQVGRVAVLQLRVAKVETKGAWARVSKQQVMESALCVLPAAELPPNVDGSAHGAAAVALGRSGGKAQDSPPN